MKCKLSTNFLNVLQTVKFAERQGSKSVKNTIAMVDAGVTNQMLVKDLLYFSLTVAKLRVRNKYCRYLKALVQIIKVQ